MPYQIWFLVYGYCFTVLVEGLVLWWALHRQYNTRERLFAILWLTACTYPIVILVLPQLISVSANRMTYLIVAEIFAPVAECLLFYAVFRERKETVYARDLVAIVLANLLSFAAGECTRIYFNA